jgi:hypothetical protein
MVDVIKPTEKWVVKIVTIEINDDCPFLVYPANYYGCCFKHTTVEDFPRCSKQTCPLRQEE